ncbi:hypothetical protein SLEP1_g1813 [Rubroshorea leprosula]|uniref:DUF4216 domain-containing protein n=1 Tax=Rubroshorea leprosula TaxID=152421 RepID=A0AAV5HJI5_9ROSI|nr:hypothetical protein SLEP1_g1813 [Rubroshorea leprosula]
MRNDDDHENGRPLGRKSKQGFQVKKRKRVARIELDDQTRIQAHRYVLFNSEEVAPFLKRHKEVIMKQRHSRRLKDHEIDKIHSQTFTFWFEEKANDLLKKRSAEITDQIKWLAHGPNNKVRRYTGYMINGFRFHTKERERSLKTQNSGVVVTVKDQSYDSGQLVEKEINYYGVLTDIIELNYSGMYKLVLFRCDWVDINRGCMEDNFGFTLVNFSYLIHQGNNLLDDPFILASQARKVYYVEDERDNGWLIVKPAKLRDVFDMGVQHNDSSVGDNNKDMTWVRTDVSEDEDGVDVTPEMEEEQVEDDELVPED